MPFVGIRLSTTVKPIDLMSCWCGGPEASLHVLIIVQVVPSAVHSFLNQCFLSGGWESSAALEAGA